MGCTLNSASQRRSQALAEPMRNSFCERSDVEVKCSCAISNHRAQRLGSFFDCNTYSYGKIPILGTCTVNTEE
jgi:hypothetical protein